MGKSPLLAGLLSLLIPGMGQIYGGRDGRGAAILTAAIIIANLNLFFLLLFTATHLDPSSAWAYWIPRIGHDIAALWSLAFWTWAVVDAYRQVKLQRKK